MLRWCFGFGVWLLLATWFRLVVGVWWLALIVNFGCVACVLPGLLGLSPGG